MFLRFGVVFCGMMASILGPSAGMARRVVIWGLLRCSMTSLGSRFLTSVIGLPLVLLILRMIRSTLERVTGVLSVTIRGVKMLFSFIWIALSPRPFSFLIFELVSRRIIQRLLRVFRLRIPLCLVASRVLSGLIIARDERIIVMMNSILVVIFDPILVIPRWVLFLPRLALILLSLSLILLNHF